MERKTRSLGSQGGREGKETPQGTPRKNVQSGERRAKRIVYHYRSKKSSISQGEMVTIIDKTIVLKQKHQRPLGTPDPQALDLLNHKVGRRGPEIHFNNSKF